MATVAVVSTSARVAYAPDQQPVEWQNAIAEFSRWGEIARLDVSLSASIGCVYVTFYDVRATASLLHDQPNRAEECPGLSHDFRAVKVNMAVCGDQLAIVGGFGAFGEVSNVSVDCGDVVVEFFDMRAAQKLLVAVGPSGSPWPSLALASHPPVTHPSLEASAFPLPAQALGGAPSLAPSSLLLSSLCAAALQYAPRTHDDAGFSAQEPVAVQMLEENEPVTPSTPPTDGPKMIELGGSGKKLIRSKVTNKDFAKYDVDPAKIQSGEDLRTTVMVRNLTGQSARQDFLNFIEIAGLSDRYTFLYMPYKEHRNKLAGFAFVNFVAPKDVQLLWTVVNQGAWRAVFRDANVKAPAVSYARFQGHEELVKHFSTSAVLREQDPDKRPIFCPNAGQGEGDATSQNVVPKTITGESADQPAFVPVPEFGFDERKNLLSKNLLSQMLSMSNDAYVGA